MAANPTLESLDKKLNKLLSSEASLLRKLESVRAQITEVRVQRNELMAKIITSELSDVDLTEDLLKKVLADYKVKAGVQSANATGSDDKSVSTQHDNNKEAIQNPSSEVKPQKMEEEDKPDPAVAAITEQIQQTTSSETPAPNNSGATHNQFMPGNTEPPKKTMREWD